MDDTQLLNNIAMQDEKAMEVFYRRHSTRLYAFILRHVNNANDANEVMNETMMEVWRKAETFEGRSQVTSWLFSIARFKAIDLLRRKGRRLDTEDEDENASDEESCSLLAGVESEEDKEHVKHCLEKLKNEQRHVVYLAFYEGLAYSDIAEIIAVPTGTVKTRMLHAKDALKRCLSRFLNRHNQE